MGVAKPAAAGRCAVKKSTIHRNSNMTHAGVRETAPVYEAGLKTATSAVGGAILGASIGGGAGAVIGGAMSIAVIYAARCLDRRAGAQADG